MQSNTWKIEKTSIVYTKIVECHHAYSGRRVHDSVFANLEQNNKFSNPFVLTL